MHFTRNLKIMNSINLKLMSEEQFDRVYTFYLLFILKKLLVIR